MFSFSASSKLINSKKLVALVLKQPRWVDFRVNPPPPPSLSCSWPLYCHTTHYSCVGHLGHLGQATAQGTTVCHHDPVEGLLGLQATPPKVAGLTQLARQDTTIRSYVLDSLTAKHGTHPCGGQPCWEGQPLPQVLRGGLVHAALSDSHRERDGITHSIAQPQSTLVQNGAVSLRYLCRNVCA